MATKLGTWSADAEGQWEAAHKRGWRPDYSTKWHPQEITRLAMVRIDAVLDWLRSLDTQMAPEALDHWL